MENVLLYNGTGKTIELVLGRAGPNQVTKIQKDQITPQVVQAYGESIAIANMDKVAIHVGVRINSQYLIRQFGWAVAGVALYKAPSRADKLQEKQDGFDASIVEGAVKAEKDLEEAVADTGTTRARVERLDKESAQRGAINVVTAAVSADKAKGTGAEPPKMPEGDLGSKPAASPEPPTPTEPETAPETPGDVDPTLKTQEGEKDQDGVSKEASGATEGVSETPPKAKSGKRKKTPKKKKAPKKKPSKKG